MKAMGFNGSPRKGWNTAVLVEKALEGARSAGAETELINLYDLNYKGCISCFACKTKGGKSYGRCPVNDDLRAVFDRIEEADALVFGSPVYLGGVTGEMHSMLERLVFQYLTYTDPPGTLFKRKIKTGFIYTMGVPEDVMNQINYSQFMKINSIFLGRTFGSYESLCSFDTMQFEDYSKYVAPRFDPVQKAKRHEEVFQVDCQKAFEMGKRLVTQ
jgi:multimeric flavodoxin WrbA